MQRWRRGTSEVASQGVVESSPTPVVGAKRAVASSSFNLPTKC
jgi:hypothetical protein